MTDEQMQEKLNSSEYHEFHRELKSIVSESSSDAEISIAFAFVEPNGRSRSMMIGQTSVLWQLLCTKVASMGQEARNAASHDFVKIVEDFIPSDTIQ